MSEPTLLRSYENYNAFRNQIEYFAKIGCIFNEHLTRFNEGAEIDRMVLQSLKENRCIEMIQGELTGKLIGVVATEKTKNRAGCNVGRVSQVIYDRDARTYKKNLNKIKSFFKGEKDKGHVDALMQRRQAYNSAPGR